MSFDSAIRWKRWTIADSIVRVVSFSSLFLYRVTDLQECVTMLRALNAITSWPRRHLGWSNSRESWFERLGSLVLIGAGLLIWWLHQRLTTAQELVACGGLVITFCILLRRGWVRLAGPVLFYELVRIARRLRYRILRVGYAILLAILMCWMYWILTLEYRERALSMNRMAAFAAGFFLTFTIVQFLVVIILTPAYTAGAVAEEKERRTMEFLLATDLRNREIILSKLFSRLANLFLLLLTGLPVLAFLQFMGGIDPNLLLACFAATAVTLFSVAALSMISSVTSRKARDAIALTYFAMAAYLLISGVASLFPLVAGFGSWPSTSNWQSPLTVDDFVHWLNSGNIISVYYGLLRELEGHGDLSAVLPLCLRDYVLFHLLFGLLFIVSAIVRVRAIALKQTVAPRGRFWPRRRFQGRPETWDSAMLWKELFAESGLRLNVLGRIAVLLLVLGSLLPIGLFASIHFGLLPWAGEPPEDWRWFSESMNVWVRIVGCLSACLMLLGVAARASSSFSGERDRQTLDSLLTTPMRTGEMVAAKWIGNVLSMRRAWFWLGGIYFLGLVTGGLHPVGVILLVIAWFVYAAVFSFVGLWFSMFCRTTLRATICTLLASITLGGGHWLLWTCCCTPLAFSAGPGFGRSDGIVYLLKFQAGLTPPFTLSAAFAFPVDEFTRTPSYGSNEQVSFVAFGVVGLLCWSLGAAALWRICCEQFNTVTCRFLYRVGNIARFAKTQDPLARNNSQWT